ncbi:MAG: HypC/HybG/HupF family hydrogenase formation chaperone [Cyanobacteria bacterium K_Offshore_surface_m2_239]|nr:HypC/HybG/HupF family hydrogenase formation chaperone [Cyanobacteria bacterium K_Offshore_surface_m2_239]
MCLAVPGRILSITCDPPRGAGGGELADEAPGPPADEALWRMAEVDFGGVRQRVSLACLPDARVGDQVLVHVGFALSLVDDAPETA